MSYARTDSWGLAGWGDPDTGKPYRIRVAHGGDVSGEVRPAAILARDEGGEPQWPDSISTRLDIVGSWIESSSYSIKVVGLDTHEAGIALREYLWQSHPLPVAMLTADITAAATGMTVEEMPGESLPATPFNMYIGREVMRCTGKLGGSGSYVLTVERGMYGTTATAHGSSAYDDAEIFTQNPICEGREVTVYEYDPSDDTEDTVLWRGILETPEIVDDALAMQLTARDSWAYLSERMLGEGRLELEGRMVNVRETPAPLTILTDTLATVVQTSVGPFADGEYVVLTDGEAVASVRVAATAFSAGTGPQSISWYTVGDDTNVPLMGTEPEAISASEALSADLARLREVLIADPLSDYSLVRDSGGTRSAHPLDVLRCIWCSTGTATWAVGGSHTIGDNDDGSGSGYDWLPAHWGAGIPHDLIAHDALDALKAHPMYSQLACENLLLGADDDSLPDLPEVTRRLLQPAFLVPAYDSQMRFSVIGLHDPGPEAVTATITQADIMADAEGLGGPPIAVRDQPWSTLQRYRRVRVDACRRGASGDHAATLLDTDIDERVRNRQPWGAPTLDVDAGDYGDPRTHRLSPSQRDALIDIGALRLAVLRDRLPEYVLTVAPWVTHLPAGSTISLTCRVLVGADAARGVTAHRCLVLESERSPSTRCQRLRVLDLYPLTRASQVVAPSWRVDSVTSTTVFTVEQTRYTDDDWATWRADIDFAVHLYDRTGALRSTDGPSQGSISSGTVTLDDPWYASGSPITPAAGDVVEVADYDEVSDWPELAWIAGSDATLGAAQDDPARWGY